MLSVVFKGGITMERKNAWTTYDEKDLQALEDVSKGYRAYLDGGKPSGNA